MDYNKGLRGALIERALPGAPVADGDRAEVMRVAWTPATVT